MIEANIIFNSTFVNFCFEYAFQRFDSLIILNLILLQYNSFDPLI